MNAEELVTHCLAQSGMVSRSFEVHPSPVTPDGLAELRAAAEPYPRVVISSKEGRAFIHIMPLLS